MTTLGSILVTALTGYGPLAALVGTRIEPNVLTQGATLPAIVYQRISTEWEQAFAGGVIGGTSRVQFTIWADDPDAGQATAVALIAGLIALRTVTPPICDMELSGETDDYEPAVLKYRAMLDAMITFTGVL